MTKYYVDDEGNYIGGFDGAEPPAGAIEVPHPPEHASNVWNDGRWHSAIDVNSNIRNAPDKLFGGPQLKEVFNGNW